MIVDDSRLVRVQLEDALAGTDYEVAAYCRSGEDAIARYAEVAPDLVTMDIIMQGMDGIDAAEIILKEHPEINIQKLAESSGFLSRSNFIKSFTEKEGCTPGKWKKANLE